MANLSVEEPDALMCARPDLWEPWAGNCPGPPGHISTRTIDRYISKRKIERGAKKNSIVSPATINEELRHIKSTLNIALEWGYLPTLPRFRWQSEPEKLPRFVTAEHLAAIYAACDVAIRPTIPNVTPAEWWRSLLTFAYLTGWRIEELLCLKTNDLDLETGIVITRHADNKGNRDAMLRLQSSILDHLRDLKHFQDVVFPWPHVRRDIWNQFREIQEAAGIHLDCDGDHDCTPSCHVYGFHDLRRAFATENAESLTATELQGLMRHKSFTTTQRYINMAAQLQSGTAVSKLFVPDVLKTKSRPAG